MTKLVSVVATSLALTAAGCIFEGNTTSCDGVTCPPVTSVPVRPGAFARRAPAESPSPRGAFPHDDGRAQSLIVDRDAGVVTFTSQRDGSTIVERWRIR
jgi:hypothetical protein